MGAFRDITGLRFGKLVVLRLAKERNKFGNLMWVCRCDCKTKVTVAGANLQSGNTRSCGCLFREALIARNTKHGLRHTPEWHIWAQMIGRCTNPKNKGYKNYGGRGITIEDPRWFDFRNFIADVGLRPSPELTLERLDNERGYYKENIAWRTRLEQSRNRRNRLRLTFNGETKILSEWAESTGIKLHTLLNRVRRGWPTEKILQTPARQGRNQYSQ